MPCSGTALYRSDSSRFGTRNSKPSFLKDCINDRYLVFAQDVEPISDVAIFDVVQVKQRMAVIYQSAPPDHSTRAELVHAFAEPLHIFERNLIRDFVPEVPLEMESPR